MVEALKPVTFDDLDEAIAAAIELTIHPAIITTDLDAQSYVRRFSVQTTSTLEFCRSRDD